MRKISIDETIPVISDDLDPFIRQLMETSAVPNKVINAGISKARN